MLTKQQPKIMCLQIMHTCVIGGLLTERFCAVDRKWDCQQICFFKW